MGQVLHYAGAHAAILLKWRQVLQYIGTDLGNVLMWGRYNGTYVTIILLWEWVLKYAGAYVANVFVWGGYYNILGSK